MNPRLILLSGLSFILTILMFTANAQTTPFIYGDVLPDAPALSQRGTYDVGVQTLDLLHKDQVDVINYDPEKDSRYDRPLKVEIWYPAQLADEADRLITYTDYLGNANDEKRPLIAYDFQGRASRDAAPLRTAAPYPLLIVSHGYTGSRLLFTYLTENLASKGYVVVSIDHTESTYQDANNFGSTLLNRSLDQLFVLDEMARLSQEGSGSFLAGLLDANNTALLGYSMGGYGVLNVAGAGYNPQAVGFFSSITNGCTALLQRTTDDPNYASSLDPRIKAVVAFAPWGMERGVWTPEGLKGLKIPTFFIAGSEDDISGYEKGVKAIYDQATSCDRYLLTYLNARHNVAPNPPPADALKAGLHIDEYLRFADSVWDQKRINNINQHFVTAFLGIHLKGEAHQKYLDLPPNANAQAWEGFKPRTAVGLVLDHQKKE